jgi:hypothetical protein
MLRWADGFDHYGLAARLREGQAAYANASGVTLDTTNPRTGTTAARLQGGFETGLRRIYGADLQTAGIGYAFFIPTLPSNSTSLCLASWRDNANAGQAVIMVSSTGQVVLRRGTNTGPIIATSAPCVYDGAYQHFEAKLALGDSDGACEVRINGVTVLNISGVDTKAAGDEIGQVQVGCDNQGVFGFPAYMLVDDIFAWDDTGSGSEVNDFVGDKKAYTRLPDGDTPTADWIPSSGSLQYPMLDNVPPLDASEYLQADDAGEETQVTVAAFPSEIVAITGVYVVTRLFKTDAGAANAQVSVVSGASVEPGTDRALSTAPVWYGDVFETDPATGAPWLLADLNDAELLLERTA